MKKVALFFLFAIISTAFVFSLEKPRYTFESDETGNFLVTNETNTELILFIGHPDFEICLGGIKRNSVRKINLRNISMPKNGCFIFRAATMECFARTPGELTDDDFIYTSLAFVSERYTGGARIPSCIDTERKTGICVSNESLRFVLELRKDKPTGDVVAAIAPGESYKFVYLSNNEDGMPYKLFPCFSYFHPDDIDINFARYGNQNTQKRVLPRPISEAASFLIRFSEPDIDYIIEKPMRLFFE